MGVFNYIFDQAFKSAIAIKPELSALYAFQFLLTIPMIDGFLLFLFFRFRR